MQFIAARAWQRGGAFCWLLACLALVSVASAQTLTFPPLTDRVVDEAGIPDATTRASLTEKLAALETKSSDQLVVATVKSLQGTSVEDYANRLFREWKLGQAKTNNGVLLLIAPNERKVRIEVGYGLEGTLTDALASTIISAAIVPHFKRGDFSGGVEAGVHGIVAVLRTDSSQWQSPALVATPKPRWFGEYVIMFIVFSVFLGAFVLFVGNLIGSTVHPRRGHRVKRHGRLVYASPSYSSESSSSSSGSDSFGSSSGSSSSSSSDFSGGGGSSGGGGASGSW